MFLVLFVILLLTLFWTLYLVSTLAPGAAYSTGTNSHSTDDFTANRSSTGSTEKTGKSNIHVCQNLCWTSLANILFSSPELKAQVSFSDHLSSVVCLSVRLSVCLSVCPSVCKLFTFSSSSPELLGQFQPNLAQSILGWWGFKFVQMKGPALFRGEIIMK